MGALTQFFHSLEYYDLELDELHTEAYGAVIVAWGRAPERYVVRFSSTLVRGEDGSLISVLNHRDIQPFGDDGVYVPSFREGN